MMIEWTFFNLSEWVRREKINRYEVGAKYFKLFRPKYENGSGD